MGSGSQEGPLILDSSIFVPHSKPLVLDWVVQSLCDGEKGKQKTAKGIKDTVLAEKLEGQPFPTELLLGML